MHVQAAASSPIQSDDTTMGSNAMARSHRCQAIRAQVWCNFTNWSDIALYSWPSW